MPNLQDALTAHKVSGKIVSIMTQSGSPITGTITDDGVGTDSIEFELDYGAKSTVVLTKASIVHVSKP